ncbi:hypothetical protein HBH1_04559 [Herbaspirillum sp. BH-1]|jgi:hypothetical protein|uniref:Secreted protein n=1 Tax=Herbaspirillum frisingense TaxID=92645 RepID=A0ABU1PJI8_9BURK|nr:MULTISPECIES: hypothetical protein [Herbaspirillum]MDR6586089.1 hypothetical protein [Herbaspirillum frisingense]PLY57162.1 hypothetical protein HBH1_04559 [Herbaspirillum sp. BH-1]
MSIARKLLWAAGMAGVAVCATLRVLARDAARRDQRQQSLALQRWEDEGGSARTVAQRGRRGADNRGSRGSRGSRAVR